MLAGGARCLAASGYKVAAVSPHFHLSGDIVKDGTRFALSLDAKRALLTETDLNSYGTDTYLSGCI
jgi:hypothetical protein